MLKSPEIRVFAGPNGSGKSTITTSEWIIPPYINADDIGRMEEIDVLTAAKKAEFLRKEAIKAHQSFTFETVLSTDRNLILLESAKEQGYFIKGYYILTCDPAINIARVMMRVSAGGHSVPVDKIVSRYQKSIELVPRFLKVCDICHIYDNSNEEPVRIVRKHKSFITFYPNSQWSEKAIEELVNLSAK